MNIKRYELLKRKELLGYLKVQELKGYVSYLDVNEINNLINKVSSWYDLKYPNYELSKLDIDNFKLEDMNILSQYMNSDELFKRLSFLENAFLTGEYRYKRAGSIKGRSNKVDNWTEVIWIDVPRKSMDPKCPILLKPLGLKVLVDVKSGYVLNVGELDDYISNVHSLKLEDLLKSLEPFKDTLDLRNIEYVVKTHDIDLELRKRILELISLKLMTSFQDSYGYFKAGEMLKDFNKELDTKMDINDILSKKKIRK